MSKKFGFYYYYYYYYYGKQTPQFASSEIGQGFIAQLLAPNNQSGKTTAG